MGRDLRSLADTARMDVPRDWLARFPVGSVWDNETPLQGDYLQVTAARQEGEFAWVEFVTVAEVDGPRDWRTHHHYGGSVLRPR